MRSPEQKPAPTQETHRVEFHGTLEWVSSTGLAEADEKPAPDVRIEDRLGREPRKPVTFQMRISLKKRVETAVLRLGGFEGGYRSMAALIDGALERELERLALEFNEGEPFPENPVGRRRD